MRTSLLENCLFEKIRRGDNVIIEYGSSYPVEMFSWGFLVPALVERNGITVVDFFGVGSILFRNYVRKVSGSEYSRIIEFLKKIKVIKVGPGTVGYGEVIDERIPVYDPQTFLREYYAIVNRITRFPMKPGYLVTFGLSHYVHFGGDKAVKSLITGLTTIPMEDWVSVHLLNVDVLEPTHLAMLEEMAPVVFQLSDEGVTLKKGCDTFDPEG
ncbi:biotin synthase [Thermococcus sp. P6]|uniref:DUF257 family protein n=1 Tax=Thermococcus sp. P6 TaxID=122420 RepID=UPI000B5A0BA2|nr:DUF257 family protein [Thermococcus sp. P6]ASJ10013.1 biotin synthase [Thermococcus sp. P6]